jgi:DNA-binding GntR family transcriptional regulator
MRDSRRNSAGTVVHHHGLAPRFAEALREHARDHVGRTAGRKPDDDAYRFRRVTLAGCATRHYRERAREQTRGPVHRLTSIGIGILRCALSGPARKIVNNMSRIVRIDTAVHGHLGSAVRERIEQLVLTGAIPAGERVNELKLAAQLDVSRGPVREALRALERAGLLVAIPNRGFFVRKIALEDALDLYDVRAGLGRVTGKLVARRISPAQLTRLRATERRMARACAERDVKTYYAANLAFHSQLIEYAGNARLTAMSVAVRNELQLYLRDAVGGAGRLKESYREHAEILAAVADGDAERAGAAFEAHILAGKQRMLDHLRRSGTAVAGTRLAP